MGRYYLPPFSARTVQPELQRLFMLIERGLDGKPLHPLAMAKIKPQLVRSIPRHFVSIEYTRKVTNRGSSFYTIVIRGPRTDGIWNIRPGDLARLVNESMEFKELPAPAEGGGKRFTWRRIKSVFRYLT